MTALSLFKQALERSGVDPVVIQKVTVAQMAVEAAKAANEPRLDQVLTVPTMIVVLLARLENDLGGGPAISVEELATLEEYLRKLIDKRSP